MLSFIMLADSLTEGYFASNLIGKSIVILQFVGSLAMFTAIIGKLRELCSIENETKRFMRDFTTSNDVLEYYLERRPTALTGLEGIYKATCDRLLKVLTPDVRSLLVGREKSGEGATALSSHEMELVRGKCDHALDEEEIRVGHGVTLITTVVALAPMLGLLGTVWGVLDAFFVMGTAGSANLATIAPSISSALVTTVVGLLIAMPGVIASGIINAKVRNITSEMEGFADELLGRIACEFQGKGA